MEKTIKISGKDVLLRANARNILIYRDAFLEDYFVAAGMIQGAYFQVTDKDGKPVLRKGKPTYDVDITKLDSLRLAKVIWTLAKTADKELPNFDDWLDSLDELPLLNLFFEVGDLIMANAFTTTQIKNADAAES